jgi:hypothetical protein
MAEGRWDEAIPLFARALETGHAWPGTDEALRACLEASLGAGGMEPGADAADPGGGG